MTPRLLAAMSLGLAALLSACAGPLPTPIETTLPSTFSARPEVSVPLTPEPSAPPSLPDPTPVGTVPIEPPYTILGESPPQEPGTIVFGELDGQDRIGTYVGWPDAGLGTDHTYAFGAYWGHPIGATRIEITLYEVKAETLHLVWTDSKPVKPDATGYLDTLVPFRRPGIYRLEVTRRNELVASALTRIERACVGPTACSGG